MAECASNHGNTMGAEILSAEEKEQNLQDQKDEMLALEAIFPDEDKIFVLSKPSDVESAKNTKETEPYKLQIYIQPDLGDSGITVEAWKPYETESDGESEDALGDAGVKAGNEKPQFQRTVSGRRWLARFHVTYLPPLTLEVTLPESYPSHTPPLFTLSGVWLDSQQLSVLCHELDKLSEENQGMPVMYLWMDWLQNDTISTLNINGTVCLGLEPDSSERDPRALPECASLEEAIIKIHRFQYDETRRVFSSTLQNCGICFDEKLGSHFFKLNDCEHHFCVDCMTEYCDLHVKEGTIQQLSCPTPKCGTPLPFGVLQAAMSTEVYERWERLQLQNSLDMMGDIEWCPRCNNAVIREAEDHLSLAHCTTCYFSFCTKCTEPWHQGNPCAVVGDLGDEEEEEGKKSKKSGRHWKMLKKQNTMSSRWVKDFSKPCPHCHAPIIKDGGCNNVTCTRCYKHMCWICGKQLREGYDHFGKCPLFSDIYTPAAIRYARVEPEGALRVRDHLRENRNRPEANNQLIHCPNCQQRNLKENRNNHIKCFSCNTNFCFQCKEKLKPPITLHYTVGAKCVQHSD